MSPPGNIGVPPALALRSVSKRFGRVLANDRVSLVVGAGSIHALVGENGAGKSTAMRIASGLYAPDSGEVVVDGGARRFASPEDAIRCGIGMVHQHFMLVDTMTVTENVVLGTEPGRPWAVDYRGAAARVAELAAELGLAVDPAAPVGRLAVGLRQRVELLKALYRRARLLILDEPTAVLVPQEVAGLFAVLHRMRREGRTIVFITHRLPEVLEVSDEVTVMRGGRVVAAMPTGATSAAELARLSVGREVPPAAGKRQPRTGGVVLAVEELTVVAGGRRQLDGVSLDVRAGEIVGIAGVEGNGQSELVEALAGLAPPDAEVSGRATLGGHRLAGASAGRRRHLGLAHVPEDRQRRGLVLDFDLAENSILGVHDRPPAASGPLGLWLDRGAIGRRAAAILERFAVRPPRLSLAARALSGGNQQKLVVGRELALAPRLLLAAQPTRGVDVGGSELIRQRLLELRDGGCAVLLVSSDLDELMALADRLLVLYRGRVAGELDPARATAEEIGRLMSGSGGAPAPEVRP
jgi:general nucleoside transport system ATP-binding protein